MLITCTAANALNYGLQFNSNDKPVAERTSLAINDGQPIAISNQFLLEFDIETRPELSMFGCVVGLTGSDGTDISIVYSPEASQFYPTLVVNDRIYPCVSPVSQLPVKASLLIDRTNDIVRFSYGTDTVAGKADLKHFTKATIIFGARVEYETPPVNIADIRIYDGDKMRCHWELSHHEDIVCYDLISQVPARATNPHWMLDDHKITRRVYSLKTAEKIQTAFDPTTSSLYIVSDSLITVVNLNDSTTHKYPIKGGYREMTMSNNLMYRPSTNELVSFDLNRGTVATFDFKTLTWSNPTDHNELEAVHANHSWALQGDSIYYSFGGYGFFRFSNDFYRIDFNNRKLEELNLRPHPAPRNGAASTIVGDKLYIFGGKGNETGRQELPTRYYYDLYEYDLNTLQGRKLWEMDTVSNIFLNASTMYFDEETNSFLLATTQMGRSIARIYLDNPSYTTVVKPLHLDMGYRDCVYDFFYAPATRTYYMLVDRLLTDKTHDLNVYAIEGPLALDNNTSQNIAAPIGGGRWPVWIIIALIIVIIIGVVAMVAIKRVRMSAHAGSGGLPAAGDTKPAIAPDNAPAPDSHSGTTPGTDSADAPQGARKGAETAPEATEEPNFESDDMTIPDELPDGPSIVSIFGQAGKEDVPKFYDRTHKAISLLGQFMVADREGNNITTSFSSRTKKLLLMLLLVNKKNKNGVPMNLIDETIWNDKDEVSARNNRNVYMRRLRLLLEKVGNITITFDNGYFKLQLDDVFIDYYEVLDRMEELENGADQETIDRILELLLYGPLLPNTSYEWLDQYKGDYSHMCLVCLNKLLATYSGSTEEADTTYRIAETILRHDTLSEEALKVQCTLLHHRHMTGLAKALYNNFCKEYRTVMGTDFPTSFQSLIE